MKKLFSIVLILLPCLLSANIKLYDDQTSFAKNVLLRSIGNKVITNGSSASIYIPEESVKMLKERYVLVIGTFSIPTNAVSFIRKVKKTGLNCEMKFLKETGYYYVFAVEYEAEINPSMEQLTSIRDKIQYKDAWYKKMDE